MDSEPVTVARNMKRTLQSNSDSSSTKDSVALHDKDDDADNGADAPPSKKTHKFKFKTG